MRARVCYRQIMRIFITCLSVLFLAMPALAAPRTYIVEKSQSTVAFGYKLGAKQLRGAFKSYDIDLVIDLQKVANSSVSVRLDVDSVRTPLPFAAEALRGASVLDVANHPTIRFRTTRVTGSGNKARLHGLVTIKGVTKPMVLGAQLFRPKGTKAGDNDTLILQLSGSLDRREFGADGFIDEVSPILTIDIRATAHVK